MKTTYTYGEKKIEIDNGIVTRSDSAIAIVGQPANLKALKACGWIKVIAPKTYYAHGTTQPTRFTK